MNYNVNTFSDYNSIYPLSPPTLLEDTSKGLLIAIEGLDGSGKSTLTKMLVKKLSKNYDVVSFNFIHSEYLKNQLLLTKLENCDPYTFLYMYLSGLSFVYWNYIIPHLKMNKIVILDRYVHTVMLKGLVQGLSKKYIEPILVPFRTADIKIFLDTSVELCLLRKLKKGKLTYWECGGNTCQINGDYLRLGYNEKERLYVYLL